MKKIRIDTSKGQYLLPLYLVAEDRANYYSIEVDGNEKDSIEYKKEVSYAMNDDFEAIDWLLNNSDWVDWKGLSTPLNESVNVTDDDFWCSSENFEIVDV